MSNELGGITNASIRDTVGSRSFTAGVLAVDGTNVENVQTTAAVVHCVNGVFQTDLATEAELDLSAIAVLAAKDGSVLSAAGATSATRNHAARAAGDGEQTLVYILACKGDVFYIIEPDLSNAATSGNGDYSNYNLSCPSGYAPFGAIKVVRAETDVAAFQLGVDDLTGITGRTSSFFDLSTCPPTVALMTTV